MLRYTWCALRAHGSFVRRKRRGSPLCETASSCRCSCRGQACPAPRGPPRTLRGACLPCFLSAPCAACPDALRWYLCMSVTLSAFSNRVSAPWGQQLPLLYWCVLNTCSLVCYRVNDTEVSLLMPLQGTDWGTVAISHCSCLHLFVLGAPFSPHKEPGSQHAQCVHASAQFHETLNLLQNCCAHAAVNRACRPGKSH